ncbi:MAG: aspartyl/asparaginyl beta-hydroxylase domain-containing protein [Flavobacteriales bacterium]|nr:aspartyl/asparaginyl beta-hydroxylase domain-containing protein [Flavobacteriales bacterium]
MKAFYNWSDKDWVKLLESNVEIIRKEAISLMNEPKGNWLKVHPDYVEGNIPWRTFEMVFFGMKIKDNLIHCNATAELLSQIPDLITADFSLLPPHTHIKPHKGYSKMIVRNHLPLIVPAGDLGIRVDDQVVKWEEGKLISFNDSLEHEAWNKTDHYRLVMMVDVASPEFEYSAQQICKYKIENMDDPFLLSIASKEKWMEYFRKGEVCLGEIT